MSYLISVGPLLRILHFKNSSHLMGYFPPFLSLLASSVSSEHNKHPLYINSLVALQALMKEMCIIKSFLRPHSESLYRIKNGICRPRAFKQVLFHLCMAFPDKYMHTMKCEYAENHSQSEYNGRF